MGYRPWGHKESDMTEQLHYYHPITALVLQTHRAARDGEQLSE